MYKATATYRNTGNFLLQAQEKNASAVKKGKDYSTFGMLMPGLQYTPPGERNSRYGFNGKENDDEVKGKGNSVDFGARIYDSRLGRWLGMDPMAAKYPTLSPYNFVGNMPTIAVDPDGKYIYFINSNNPNNDPEIEKQNFEKIVNYLNSTQKGQALLQEYINNPDKDIYIVIGQTSKNDNLGQTVGYIDAEGKKVNPPSVDIGSNTYLIGLDKSMSEFEGLKLINKNAENNFVILNENMDNIGTEEMKDADVPYLKKQAKVLGHEIGAHVSGKEGNTPKQDHDDWGQEHYIHPTEIGTNGAAELNGQMNNLKAGDVKRDGIKLRDQAPGVYKLESK